jgi:hypothetical protein
MNPERSWIGTSLILLNSHVVGQNTRRFAWLITKGILTTHLFLLRACAFCCHSRDEITLLLITFPRAKKEGLKMKNDLTRA